jgi:K(+)-stimulated pyrophosphate-energized sodium pump
MNILIKLTCLIGLVIAPILGGEAHTVTNKAAMSCCANMGECASMSKEECMEKGCTSKTCKFMNQDMNQEVSKRVIVEKTKINDENVQASVKVISTVDGNETVEEFNFEGNEEEVDKEIRAIK